MTNLTAPSPLLIASSKPSHGLQPEVQTIPDSLYPALLAALQEDISPAYDVVWQDGAYQAVNPNQHFRITFTPTEFRVAPEIDTTSSWKWGMALVGWGYGDNIQPVPESEVMAAGTRLEYRHGPLTEWYVNTPLGIEQGFTLQAPPASQGRRGELTLELVVSDELVAILNEDGQGITFSDHNGAPILGYNHLYVTDVTGYLLPARLELASPKIGADPYVRIILDDRCAVYPITIDPLVQEQAEIIGSDTVTG